MHFESRCHGIPGEKSGPFIGRNLPEVVNKVVWVRQLIHKVTECLSVQTYIFILLRRWLITKSEFFHALVIVFEFLL